MGEFRSIRIPTGVPLRVPSGVRKRGALRMPFGVLIQVVTKGSGFRLDGLFGFRMGCWLPVRLEPWTQTPNSKL